MVNKEWIRGRERQRKIEREMEREMEYVIWKHVDYVKGEY